MQIVYEFLKNGGNVDYIRYTNGEKIFATNQEDVQNYYRNSHRVEFCSDIYEEMQKAEDITKLTLAGKKDQMKQSAEFVQSLDFWTDMDKTGFPRKDCNNYRLDISQKNINKGEAVKALVSMLKPIYGYLCVGNGRNDISMFKTAIDDGMIAAIMSNSASELLEEMEQYAKNRKGKVKKVPTDKNLANKYILKMAKEFQSCEKTAQREFYDRTRLPYVERVKIGIDTSRKGNNYSVSRRKNQER